MSLTSYLLTTHFSVSRHSGFDSLQHHQLQQHELFSVPVLDHVCLYISTSTNCCLCRTMTLDLILEHYAWSFGSEHVRFSSVCLVCQHHDSFPDWIWALSWSWARLFFLIKSDDFQCVSLFSTSQRAFCFPASWNVKQNDVKLSNHCVSVFSSFFWLASVK